MNIVPPSTPNAQPPKYTRWSSFEERFWGRIEVTESCWLWTGLLLRGYGRTITAGGVRLLPHRLSYMMHVGPIPEGHQIDHLCRVRNCVNPDHLEAVTQAENTRRAVDAHWVEPCRNGHAATFRTTTPAGRTKCMECARESARRAYAKNPGAKNERTVRARRARRERAAEVAA